MLSTHLGSRIPVSPLHLFASHAQLEAALAANPRLRVLLLRHFSPQQAKALLASEGGGGEASINTQVCAPRRPGVPARSVAWWW